ncbi:MAG: hypothetical protein WDO70_00070 [Alphaproteobacteria bacterium]
MPKASIVRKGLNKTRNWDGLQAIAKANAAIDKGRDGMGMLAEAAEELAGFMSTPEQRFSDRIFNLAIWTEALLTMADHLGNDPDYAPAAVNAARIALHITDTSGGAFCQQAGERILTHAPALAKIDLEDARDALMEARSMQRHGPLIEKIDAALNTLRPRIEENGVRAIAGRFVDKHGKKPTFG